MAIGYDAVSTATETSSSSKTWSHTCTGSDRILFVGGWIRGNGNNCMGITYNGVAMTQIQTNVVSSTVYYDKGFLFYLINPATGANNVVATFNSANYNNGISVSYTGAKQSAQPDNSNTQTTTSTSTTDTITTVADNCWTVLLCSSSNASGTAGSGSTLRGGSANAKFFDSNTAKTPAGSTSMSLTSVDTTGAAHIMASFAPAVASSTNSGFLMFM
jgi:hypothetical protein